MSLIHIIAIIFIISSCIPLISCCFFLGKGNRRVVVWPPEIPAKQNLMMMLRRRRRLRLPKKILRRPGITARATGLLPTVISRCVNWNWQA